MNMKSIKCKMPYRSVLVCFSLFVLAFVACQNPLDKVIIGKIDGVTDMALSAVSVKLSADTDYAAEALSPAFDPEVTEYTVTGDSLICLARLSATLRDAGAKLEWRDGESAWTTLGSGQSTSDLKLTPGTRKIFFRVTSENGLKNKTYTINLVVPAFGTNSPAILTSPNPSSTGRFGYKTAMSDDGSVLAVAGGGGTSVYVYEKSGSSWTLVNSLSYTGITSSDYFGSGLAMTRDGSVIAVGAQWKDVSAQDNGAIYVFRRNGSSWASAYTADPFISVPGSGNYYHFGASVAISDDGKFLAGGAFPSPGSATGCAYVYAYANATWTAVVSNLCASDASNDGGGFGYALAISGDGTKLAVGAPSLKIVYFYSATSSWSEIAKYKYVPTTSGDNSSEFGHSVAMSQDGSHILVGATNAISNSVQSGVVLSLDFPDWSGAQTPSLEAILQPSVAAISEQFGWSLSLSGDNRYLAVGSTGKAANGLSSIGAAYVFSNDGSTWTQIQQYDNPHPVQGDMFGIGLAISRDGSKVAIGAHNRGVGDNADQGVLYIY